MALGLAIGPVARTTGLIALAILLLGDAGAAAAAGTCPTLLPDFHCERQGRWSGWVAPMSMPYFFEDPFITTEAQFVGIYHEFPNDSVFAGGEAGVIALQLRVALTDKLAFIASQDGYTILRPDDPVVPDNEGFMDLMAGLKYALVELPDRHFILTPSLRYQIPTSKRKLFQGFGDGAFVVGASTGWSPGNQLGADLEALHLIGDAGIFAPVDDEANSTFVYWNVHADYAVLEFLVPFIDFNGISYVKDGAGNNGIATNGLGRLPLDTVQAALGTGGFEGFDVANLGSDDVAGNNIVTFAVGVRVPLDHHWSLGGSYERPITSRRDIFGQRVTFMTTFVY